MPSIKKTTLGLLLCSTALPGCARVHRVVPSAEATRGEFAYYALPRTVVVATFTASVSNVNASPACASEAKLMAELGLKQSPYQGRIFNITKTELSRRSEADPDAVFAVKLNGPGTRSVGLEMGPTGVPSVGSSKAEDTVIPAVVAAAKLAADIVAPFVGAGPTKSVSSTSAACQQAATAITELRGRLLDLHSTRGAEDPKDILEYKAAKLTARIKTLEGKFTGVALGKPKKIVCESIPTTGKALGPLLTWSKANGLSDVSDDCDVPDGLATDRKAELSCAAPDPTRVGKPSLCTKPSAPSAASPQAGAPATPAATPSPPPKMDAATRARLEQQAKAGREKLEQALRDGHEVSLGLQLRKTDVATTPPPEDGQREQRSFYYRRPASTRVWVEDKNTRKQSSSRTSAVKDWAVAQLGTLHSIPRLWTAGKIELAVAFDPETGALTKLELSRTAADLKPAAEAAQAIGTQLRNAEISELERTKTLRELREALETNDDELNPGEDDL